MNRLPTDRKVLRCIYDMYKGAYPGNSLADGKGENDPYLPIDVFAIAKRLNTKPELIFGRLYYYLDSRHSYKQEGGALVPLFQVNFQGKRHCVHFPFLASILADLEFEHSKYWWPLVVSVVAALLSLGAVVAQVVTAANEVQTQAQTCAPADRLQRASPASGGG